MVPDVTVDARGLFCPMPILKLAQAVQRAGAGAMVQLLATDPAVGPDVTAWCESTGHHLVALRDREGGGYEAWIRTSG